MNILRIYTKLPPLKGGMEKHIFHLSREQIGQGHRVKVIFNDGEKITPADEKIGYFKLYKIRPQAVGVMLFYGLIGIRFLFDRQSYDVVHIHGDWSALLFATMIKKLVSAKCVVFSIHGTITQSFAHQNLLPKLLRQADLIFSTGYDTAQEITKLTGREVYVQPSGISDVFFEPFDKKFDFQRFMVVTVANLFAVKNIELVFEIAKRLKECDFIIIGDGPEKKRLQDLLAKEKINNVTLAGFKTTPEVKEYYQKSDCYLLTSFAEGTPTSALEAMACGLPIVSSNAGGIGHIVKAYQNGFVLDDFDPNRYADKIKRLKDDPKMRKDIFNNNSLLAREYKWKNVAGRITAMLRSKLDEAH